MLGCEKAGGWGGELGLWESQSWRMILEWFLLLGNNGYQEPLAFSLSAVVSEIFDLIYMKCRNKKSSFLDYLSYMLWFWCISVVQLMHTIDYMKWTLLVIFTMGTSTKPSHLGLREHWWRGAWKDLKSHKRGFAVRQCLMVLSEATPTKSPQHACPNMSWTMRMPMNMPNCTGKAHKTSSLHRNYEQLKKAGGRRGGHPQRGSHQLVIIIIMY